MAEFLGAFDVDVLAELLRGVPGRKPEVEELVRTLGVAPAVGEKPPLQVGETDVEFVPPDVGRRGLLEQLGAGIQSALANRNILKLLAGIGTELDPQGIGGMLGRPITRMIEAVAAQEAVKRKEQERERSRKLLLDLLTGGFTAKDQPGPTKLTMDDTGFRLDVTAPSAERLRMEPSLEKGITAAPRGGRLGPSDILPFY